ncbi:hypothetical protein B7486_06935 [cyanobacterium TDX16]|nr:hypothetical protein B7486_06935 [cyanobacterium TDX16]
MPDFVFLNGKIVPASEARVSVFDAGFTHAAGLFETMRAYGGKVMRLDAHLLRLMHSASTLEIQMPAAMEAAVPSATDDLRQGIADVLSANELTNARLRLVMTPGDIPRPGQDPEHRASPTVLVTASPVQPYPEQLYTRGMRVCISPYKQNRHDPLAGHKTLAYLPRLLAMKDAADRQCQEALWFTAENRLAEGSICNVFVVMGDRVLTPPVDTPVLPGVVRASIIEVCHANDIQIEEAPIDINMLMEAQEVFLTGTVLEVMPVTSIEKHMVGDGAVGDISKRIGGLYRELVARECDLI